MEWRDTMNLDELTPRTVHFTLMYEDKEIVEHHNIKLTETIEEIQIENEKIVKETKIRIYQLENQIELEMGVRD